MLKKSAYDNNINLSVKTNREILIDTDFSKKQHSMVDFILFWDKDVLLARHLEECGYRVYNPSEAIRICDDKALTHIVLSNRGIPMPRTIVAPFTYENSYPLENTSEKEEFYLKDIVEKIGFPMVVKTRYGSFGSGVYLVYNYEELVHISATHPAGSLIFQEYIETSKGRDIRLQVVGDKVVCSMYRYSDIDFRANITNGGKMKLYSPTAEEEKLAIKVCKELKLDFAGVDILYGKNNEPILCEVNSNAHFVNLYNLTGINTADYIMKHILDTL
jgi:RimK family alpha-L-glutamate ligase